MTKVQAITRLIRAPTPTHSPNSLLSQTRHI